MDSFTFKVAVGIATIARPKLPVHFYVCIVNICFVRSINLDGYWVVNVGQLSMPWSGCQVLLVVDNTGRSHE